MESRLTLTRTLLHNVTFRYVLFVTSKQVPSPPTNPSSARAGVAKSGSAPMSRAAVTKTPTRERLRAIGILPPPRGRNEAGPLARDSHAYATDRAIRVSNDISSPPIWQGPASRFPCNLHRSRLGEGTLDLPSVHHGRHRGRPAYTATDTITAYSVSGTAQQHDTGRHLSLGVC